jgi:DNA-binding MltR family transcriptional regulator
MTVGYMNKPLTEQGIRIRTISNAEIAERAKKIAADILERDAAEQKDAAEANRRMLRLDQKAQAAYIMIEASAMDSLLQDLIKTRMPQLNNTLKQKLFQHSGGPFHGFSSKIDTAYVLGLIDASTYKDLVAFKAIRNEFAHTKIRLHFDKDPIASLFPRFADYNEGANKREFIEEKATGIRAALNGAMQSIATGAAEK